MRRMSLWAIMLWVLTCCGFPILVLADKQPASCLDHNSPDRTISRCTEIINRGDKELAANLGAAYWHRGDAYLFYGKTDNAISDLTNAIRLMPNADAYTSRGAAYYQKGDINRAKADWAQAKRLRDSSMQPQ